jgi:hypothetical protein
MDISGRLIQVLQEQGGEGKNGRWAKCDFVIETQEKYPKKVCITAWNDLIGTVKGLPLESEVKVAFDIASREYNGKWYTDVKAWKVEAGSGGNGGGPTAPSRSTGYSNADAGANNGNQTNEGSQSQERYVSEDDLPF